MPFTVGENVGPYRILEQLGQGGMATVYKAYHAALDRYVAIKVLHPAFTQDPNFLSRFQREARVVAKLEHPNIVPVYDFAEHEGQPYLVMKFIQGETLKARLNRAPLSPEEVLRVVEAVGSALAYAHQQGILHRDIKPSNIILAEDGHIYLADFGLARIAQAGESTLSTDMLLGTPQYISPEQALGKPDLDEGTDIYSFGVVLYELVVGRVPYSADTPYSIIHDHIYTPLPLPRKINPEVPEAVERVLLKALAKERADRYDNVESLVSAFREAYSVQAAPQPLSATGQPASTVAVESPSDAAPTRLEQAAPTQRAEALVTTAQPPKAEAQAEADKSKRRWRWWYLIPMAFACLCTLMFLGAASRNNARRDAATAIPTAIEQEVTAGPPSSSPTAADLEAALQYMYDHPDDPYAYLPVAEAYINQDNFQEASRFLEMGASKAGQDTDYFVTAGDMLMRHHLPVAAAQAYLFAVQVLGQDAPRTLVNKLHESLYQAASHPSFAREIEFSAIAEMDLALAGVLKARQALHQGNVQSAQELLDSVLQRKPNMPEAYLLQAEIHLQQGETQTGITELRQLADSDAPLWIRQEALRLLQKQP